MLCCTGNSENPLLQSTAALALIEMPNTIKCVYTVEVRALLTMYSCVRIPVCIFLCMSVRLIRLICMKFNEPWTAVPGQDEQLLSDWSITWWWSGGLQDVFPHERPVIHLSPLVLYFNSLVLHLPPLILLFNLFLYFSSCSNSEDDYCNKISSKRMNHPLS